MGAFLGEATWFLTLIAARQISPFPSTIKCGKSLSFMRPIVSHRRLIGIAKISPGKTNAGAYFAHVV